MSCYTMSMSTGNKFSAQDELLAEKIITGVSKKVSSYIFELRDRIIVLEKEIIRLSKNGHPLKKPTTARTIYVRVGIAVLCAIAIAVLPALFEFLANAFK